MSRLAIIFFIVILVASATNDTTTHENAQKAFDQAKKDLSKKISCWETDNDNKIVVSRPIYDLCRYDQVWPNSTHTMVNGIIGGENILPRFEAEDRAVLMFCEYNALPETETDPSIVTLTCYCKRNGCNFVTPINSLLYMNAKPIPQIMFGKY